MNIKNYNRYLRLNARHDAPQVQRSGKGSFRIPQLGQIDHFALLGAPDGVLQQRHGAQQHGLPQLVGAVRLRQHLHDQLLGGGRVGLRGE